MSSETAVWSHANNSVISREQFPLFVLGKSGLVPIPTGAMEASPVSSSGYGQRTSSADRARHSEHRTEHQELSPQALPSKARADDEDPGQQKATHSAPSSKPRKRHAVKPATALDVKTGHPRHAESASE
jgi:hypothetical protein